MPGGSSLQAQDLSHTGMAARVQAGLVRSYQITSVFKRLSTLDNLCLAMQARRPGVAFLAPAASDGARAMKPWPCWVALAWPRGLNRRRAVWLMASSASWSWPGLGRPPALCCCWTSHWPAWGPRNRPAWWSCCALRHETTLLLVEHDMDAVFRLADRITTLVAGRVIASDTPDAIRAHPRGAEGLFGDELEALP